MEIARISKTRRIVTLSGETVCGVEEDGLGGGQNEETDLKVWGPPALVFRRHRPLRRSTQSSSHCYAFLPSLARLID